MNDSQARNELRRLITEQTEAWLELHGEHLGWIMEVRRNGDSKEMAVKLQLLCCTCDERLSMLVTR